MVFTTKALRRLLTIAAVVLLAVTIPTKIFAQNVGASSIGGVVTSA